MIVHVVSYSPCVNGPNSVGGFDWFPDRAAAVSCLQKTLADDDPGLNLALVEVAIPNTLTDRDDITNYLDTNMSWFEPAGGPLEKDLG